MSRTDQDIESHSHLSSQFCLGIGICSCYTLFANSGGQSVMARENITFRCSVCGEENYIGTRNKRKHTEKMEIKKYCPKCHKKTVHKEKK